MAAVEMTEQHPKRTPLARISLLVVGALLLSGASWLAGAAAGRGADSAATLRRPRASLVTARVEDRTVVSSLTGRASVGYADVVDLAGPAAGGRVTALPTHLGDDVTEGKVLVEVDGRPTIALVGPVPMYRPLVIGTTGPDVLEFEQALERLGIDRGPVDSTFDAATEAGVREFFRRAGYEPVDATAEQRAAYASAQEAVTQARLAVLTHEHEVELDAKGPDPGARVALDKAVADADAALDKARRDATALAPALDAGIAAATTALDDAVAQLATARQRLGELPAAADAATRSQLESARDLAVTAANTARSTYDALVRERPNRLADAFAAVASAQSAADVARTERSDQLVSKDRDVLARTLAVSREALSLAEEKLADQAAVVGAGVRVSEVVFFPSLPRRVQQVDAKVGNDAAGSLMQISGGDPVGRWFVTASDRALLRIGGAATLSDTLSGLQLTGTIAAIATTPGDPATTRAGGGGDDGTGGSPPGGSGTGATATGSSAAAGSGNANLYLVTVAITRTAATPPNSELVSRDLLVSAPISESAKGLAVPLAAVTSRPDGSAVVRRATDEFDAVAVPVTIGASGDGYAQVVPVRAGSLAAGDRVVVGT